MSIMALATSSGLPKRYVTALVSNTSFIYIDDYFAFGGLFSNNAFASIPITPKLKTSFTKVWLVDLGTKN
jgi:hypothetical protein